jgi:hypothetical protein
MTARTPDVRVFAKDMLALRQYHLARTVLERAAIACRSIGIDVIIERLAGARKISLSH